MLHGVAGLESVREAEPAVALSKGMARFCIAGAKLTTVSRYSESPPCGSWVRMAEMPLSARQGLSCIRLRQCGGHPGNCTGF